jgi:protease IV
MLQFLKYIFATIVGIFLFFFGGIVLLLLIASASSPGKIEIADNSVLHLKLDTSIKEIGQENPFEGLDLPIFSSIKELSVFELKKVLAAAEKEDKVKGIYLEVSDVAAGYAILQEVREALEAFKETGKFVVSYGEFYSERAYFLASVADKVYLHPQGLIEFNGLSAEVMFYKGFMDKFSIKPQIFRVGEYKNAVEPYIREGFSQESQLQIKSYLGSMYDFYLANVGRSRLGEDSLRYLSENMLAQSAWEAEAHGLVDGLLYKDQVKERLKEACGLSDDEALKLVSVNEMSQAGATQGDGAYSSNKIAVLRAEGEIVGGKGSNGLIGDVGFIKELRKLRDDKKVKAIVLRINSPGGSAMASENIWREIGLAREKKPVIASMSNAAASGGYYMAMGCDTIVAQPNTITGSIGIFILFLQLDELLSKELGITFDVVNTGKHSDFASPFDDFSAFEKAKIQQMVDEGYKSFTEKAAQGRGLPLDSLLQLAGGRVWTGQQAQENGLVDVLGGMEEAIRIAAEKAGVDEDYMVKYYPAPQSFLESILGGAQVKANDYVQRQRYGMLYPWLQKLEALATHQQGLQARMEAITVK